MYKRRFAPLKVKSAGGDDGLEEGRFEAYASVFGNVDSYGDVVEKGAFTRTLSEWAERDEEMPVLWGHDMADPFSNIGVVLEAAEDEHGLKIAGQLDLDNPTAMQVYRLIKGRRTNRMSFAYSIVDSKRDGDVQKLLDLDLFEVSIVQVPANELAEITAVKSAVEVLAKAGRSLSAKNEQSLRDARDAIDSVLESLDNEPKATNSGGSKHDQEQANGEPEAKPDAVDEDLEGKSATSGEEPKAAPSVDRWRQMFAIYSTAYVEERDSR